MGVNFRCKADHVFVSKCGFRCAYCNKKRTGAYRLVDGAKSCEKCNRAYDYVPKDATIHCPLCKRGGWMPGHTPL